MTNAVGFVDTSLGFSEQQTIATTTRYIAEIAGFVPFEENHSDQLEVTEHPIEQGAKISDHAFKRPAKVTVKIGWSNSTVGGTSGSSHSGTSSQQVAEIYQTLLGLQASREPFPVMTGKRLYDNMLLVDLSVSTDKTSENTLMVTAVFQEVILVTTESVLVDKVPAEAQASPETTQSTTNTGSKQLTESNTINQGAVDSVLGE
jgi:hypothetical protein